MATKPSIPVSSRSQAKGEEACLPTITSSPSTRPFVPNAGEGGLFLRTLRPALLHVAGPRLDHLVELLHSALKREIGGTMESIPSKELLRKCKDYICVGVNNVTRTLERMPYACSSSIIKKEEDRPVQGKASGARCPKGGKTTLLQAVLVATDVHPRLLASHLPDLAASRKVPCITVSGGNGAGSLRLGEILNLRTAIAIGLKVGESGVNKTMGCFLKDECGSEVRTT